MPCGRRDASRSTERPAAQSHGRACAAQGLHAASRSRCVQRGDLLEQFDDGNRLGAVRVEAASSAGRRVGVLAVARERDQSYSEDVSTAAPARRRSRSMPGSRCRGWRRRAAEATAAGKAASHRVRPPHGDQRSRAGASSPRASVLSSTSSMRRGVPRSMLEPVILIGFGSRMPTPAADAWTNRLPLWCDRLVRQRAAVQLGQASCKCQAEPESALVPVDGARPLRKRLEDRRHQLLRDCPDHRLRR